MGPSPCLSLLLFFFCLGGGLRGSPPSHPSAAAGRCPLQPPLPPFHRCVPFFRPTAPALPILFPLSGPTRTTPLAAAASVSGRWWRLLFSPLFCFFCLHRPLSRPAPRRRLPPVRPPPPCPLYILCTLPLGRGGVGVGGGRAWGCGAAGVRRRATVRPLSFSPRSVPGCPPFPLKSYFFACPLSSPPSSTVDVCNPSSLRACPAVFDPHRMAAQLAPPPPTGSAPLLYS